MSKSLLFFCGYTVIMLCSLLIILSWNFFEKKRERYKDALRNARGMIIDHINCEGPGLNGIIDMVNRFMLENGADISDFHYILKHTPKLREKAWTCYKNTHNLNIDTLTANLRYSDDMVFIPEKWELWKKKYNPKKKKHQKYLEGILWMCNDLDIASEAWDLFKKSKRYLSCPCFVDIAAFCANKDVALEILNKHIPNGPFGYIAIHTEHPEVKEEIDKILK